MEMAISTVAEQVGRSVRFVQQAVRNGDLHALRLVGRTVLLDDIAVRAWRRSLARGRRWAPDVREAAFELLSDGVTSRLSASERSRLRGRLRVMPAAEIAHASGGLAGGWCRYRVDVVPELPLVGPSAVDPAELGMVVGRSWMSFVEVADLDQLELEHDVALDADGNLGVIERAERDDRAARVLLDTYLLGDERQSSAAASRLEARACDV